MLRWVYVALSGLILIYCGNTLLQVCTHCPPHYRVFPLLITTLPMVQCLVNIFYIWRNSKSNIGLRFYSNILTMVFGFVLFLLVGSQVALLCIVYFFTTIPALVMLWEKRISEPQEACPPEKSFNLQKGFIYCSIFLGTFFTGLSLELLFFPPEILFPTIASMFYRIKVYGGIYGSMCLVLLAYFITTPTKVSTIINKEDFFPLWKKTILTLGFLLAVSLWGYGSLSLYTFIPSEPWSAYGTIFIALIILSATCTFIYALHTNRLSLTGGDIRVWRYIGILFVPFITFSLSYGAIVLGVGKAITNVTGNKAYQTYRVLREEKENTISSSYCFSRVGATHPLLFNNRDFCMGEKELPLIFPANAVTIQLFGKKSFFGFAANNFVQHSEIHQRRGKKEKD